MARRRWVVVALLIAVCATWGSQISGSGPAGRADRRAAGDWRSSRAAGDTGALVGEDFEITTGALAGVRPGRYWALVGPSELLNPLGTYARAGFTSWTDFNKLC